MPAPNVQLTFSAGVEALRRMEEQRKAREDRMRNALAIIEATRYDRPLRREAYSRFVRATAREGLGRGDAEE